MCPSLLPLTFLMTMTRQVNTPLTLQSSDSTHITKPVCRITCSNSLFKADHIIIFGVYITILPRHSKYQSIISSSTQWSSSTRETCLRLHTKRILLRLELRSFASCTKKVIPKVPSRSRSIPRLCDDTWRGKSEVMIESSKKRLGADIVKGTEQRLAKRWKREFYKWKD